MELVLEYLLMYIPPEGSIHKTKEIYRRRSSFSGPLQPQIPWQRTQFVISKQLQKTVFARVYCLCVEALSSTGKSMTQFSSLKSIRAGVPTCGEVYGAKCAIRKSFEGDSRTLEGDLYEYITRVFGNQITVYWKLCYFVVCKSYKRQEA